MNLTKYQNNKEELINKGYILPEYDRDIVKRNTATNPEWVHFGCGNIFRAFPVELCDKMLSRGLTNTGIIAVEGYDYEIIDKAFIPYDNISISVSLKSDGSIDKRILGSITESYKLDPAFEDWKKIKHIFENKSLKMSSFTITEKGYQIFNQDGSINKSIASDILNGPEMPESYLGKITALLYFRFLADRLPVAMVSMDNCSHNGEKLKAGILYIANEWENNKKAISGFVDYLNDNQSGVSFPITMIDKITPRPDLSIKDILAADGISDIDIIETTKKSFTASFVNSEESEYLIIEDNFPNGRLNLDKVSSGVVYTDKETVNKVEKMKVCTCLNPLHTALAVFGCLLGYNKISDEMSDQDLLSLITTLGYKEGMPVVIDPGIISPKDFLDVVLKKRLPNPYIPDTPQRIATDTSQKLSVRYGETVKLYKANNLEISSLKCIPLIYAAWCRYLLGIDDNGQSFSRSPDPLFGSLDPIIANIKFPLDDSFDISSIRMILSNESIFGYNLYDTGLGKKTEELFIKMCNGCGEIRNTLHQTVTSD